MCSQGWKPLFCSLWPQKGIKQRGHTQLCLWDLPFPSYVSEILLSVVPHGNWPSCLLISTGLAAVERSELNALNIKLLLTSILIRISYAMIPWERITLMWHLSVFFPFLWYFPNCSVDDELLFCHIAQWRGFLASKAESEIHFKISIPAFKLWSLLSNWEANYITALSAACS